VQAVCPRGMRRHSHWTQFTLAQIDMDAKSNDAPLIDKQLRFNSK